MSNIEEHCKCTLKRYGVEGRDFHYGSMNLLGNMLVSQTIQNDTETIKLVGEIFGKR